MRFGKGTRHESDDVHAGGTAVLGENENIRTAIAFLWGLSCTELGVLSALLRALTEEEAIAHACVSKSRYYEVKKHLLEIMDLPPKTGIGKNRKNGVGHCVKTTDMIS